MNRRTSDVRPDLFVEGVLGSAPPGLQPMGKPGFVPSRRPGMDDPSGSGLVDNGDRRPEGSLGCLPIPRIDRLTDLLDAGPHPALGCSVTYGAPVRLAQALCC